LFQKPLSIKLGNGLPENTSIFTTQDGSFLLLTNEKSFNDNQNWMLTKVDTFGSPVWSLPIIFGGEGLDTCGSVQELPDGRIVLIGTMRTGKPDAGIVLVEFGDYQCPHCGHAHPLIKKLLKEKGKDFLFVFRNFPLQEAHPAAFMAALAAEGVRRDVYPLERVQAQLPDDVKLTYAFDQSVYVINSVKSLISEGARRATFRRRLQGSPSYPSAEAAGAPR